jgi:acylphosphatase
MVTRKYSINGIVQGVGYRYFVFKICRELELSGWVRNRPDGSVEVLACGELESHAELEKALNRGPILARVQTVTFVTVEDQLMGAFKIIKG